MIEIDPEALEKLYDDRSRLLFAIGIAIGTFVRLRSNFQSYPEWNAAEASITEVQRIAAQVVGLTTKEAA